MNSERYSQSEFSLSFENIMWSGETRLGFPVIRWPSGSLVEESALYFGFCLQERMGVSISSLRPEAYALREWFTYLRDQRKRLDQVDDLVLANWRESHREAINAEQIHEHQVERKLHTVYTFYRLLQIGAPLDHMGRTRRLLVAPTERDNHCPISTKIVTTRRGRQIPVWGRSKKAAPKGTVRPTPDGEEVDALLSWLRTAPERRPGTPSSSSLERSHLASERNWLLARTQSESGFRASEAVKFSLSDVYNTLRDENIILQGGPASLMRLTEHERQTIDTALSAIEAKRKHIYVRIKGKGKKTRYAAMSLNLFRDIIDIGILSVRKRQVEIWYAAGKMEESDSVFLSFETRAALKPGSLGDIIKESFRNNGIRGSGHRLRAHYCTFMAISLWEEAMMLNGFVFTQSLETTVLHRLADAMGHKSVNTSVRYYLDLAIARNLGAKNRTKYSLFKSLWKELSNSIDILEPSDIKLINNIISAISSSPNEKLRDVLNLVLGNKELNPDLSNDPSHKRSSIMKIVN